MIDLIFDTNILIYILKRDPIFLQLLEEIKEKRIGISVITYMEIFMGNKNIKEFEILKDFLSNFEIINLNKDIGMKVVEILQSSKYKNLKGNRLPDIIIGATAILQKVPLITNNAADFKFMPKKFVREVR